MSDVAFLVYAGRTKREKRATTTFDGWSNVGAYVVRDVLERAGIGVGWTTANAAHLYRVVLVSLTSLFDVYNFIESVADLELWQPNRRQFTVIAGGPGMQNVYPLRRFVDYAAFGRAEPVVVDLVKAALAGRDFDSRYVMPLREEIRPVWMAQADGVYPHAVQVGDFLFQEVVLGCPLRCAFCHYTHSRKWQGGDASEYVRRGEYQRSVEGLFAQSAELVDPENPQTRIITGVDGLSERLRYAVGKRISNEMLLSVLAEASSRSNTLVRYKMYMIAGYPSEVADDMAEFVEVMRQVQAPGARLLVTVHLTPFRAMPLTPAAWLPVAVDRDFTTLANQDIAVADNYKAWWTPYIDGALTHLMDMIIARATPDSDDLIYQLATNWRLRGMRQRQQFDLVASHWDITDYVRGYAVHERLPTWYLRSYQPDGALERAATRLHRVLGVQ